MPREQPVEDARQQERGNFCLTQIFKLHMLPRPAPTAYDNPAANPGALIASMILVCDDLLHQLEFHS